MTTENKSYPVALAVLTLLFFMWGFIICLNGSLKPLLQGVFKLSDFQTAIVDGAFFTAFFFMSVPAGILVKKIGYKHGCVIGLIVCALGAFLYFPASEFINYPLFLMATFVIATGVTILQVAANPFVIVLGPAESSSSRLNMTQGFNSLGATVAPLIFMLLVFKMITPDMSSVQKAQIVQCPYIGLGILLIALAVIFSTFKLPDPGIISNGSTEEIKEEKAFEKLHASVWGYRHLLLGVFAIFAYVGAEVAIGNNIIRFLSDKTIAGMTNAEAAPFQATYWGGAMIGRFFGAVLLSGVGIGVNKYLKSLGIVIFAFFTGWFVTHEPETSWLGENVKFGAIFMGVSIINFLAFQIGKNSDNKSLGVFACMAALLVLISVFASGMISVWALISVGFFNSIMFPTIFCLGAKNLGKHIPQGSEALCMGIVGGGVVPMIWGLVSDNVGVKLAFLVCAICYGYIAFYGMSGSTLEKIE